MANPVVWGIIITILIVGAGALIVVPLWLRVRNDRLADRLLAERGVPANAEVLTIDHDDFDGERRSVITLRFTGPGIAPFEATHRCGATRYVVGDQLSATVDPTTNHFTVPALR